MLIYDIEILDVNENDVKLDSGYLNLHEHNGLKSWDIELYGTNNDNDELFSSLYNSGDNAKLKIVTRDGKGFLGMAFVINLNSAPLGTSVNLKGNGKLDEI
jgi:hypothetical protein